MKIGIFDSGVGGLIVAKAIRQKMPKYDYVYLGDTKRVPYGNRSHKTVFGFTREGVDYLFRKENCIIVIVACNTASARALRKMQQEYLPKNFLIMRGEKNQRKILGVLIPAAEEASKYKRIGVLATTGTVVSKTFVKEKNKINPKANVFQNHAPMLVPLIEAGDFGLATEFIKKYLKAFENKKLDVLVLGCTHYPILKNQIKKEIKKLTLKDIKIISQDEIIPKKLKEYFVQHPEIEKKISRKGTVKILVTDMTENVAKLSSGWFGKVKPKVITLSR